jgi:hypothetical protein
MPGLIPRAFSIGDKMVNQDLMAKELQRYLKQEKRRANLKRYLAIFLDSLALVLMFAMLYGMLLIGHAFGLT